MWILYQAALALVLLAVAPVLLARRGRHYLPTLAGRLGRAPAGGAAITDGRRPLWLHAVSVGEVGVAATLVRALPADLPLLVTTVTPTGQARARAELGGRAAVAYLPFDLGFAVARFFRRHHPRGLILVEGDYWPLLLRAGRRRGLPAVVVNGRVGDASLRRMRRLRPFLGPLFGPIDRFGVQTAEDRDRLVELGVATDKVVVTGNLKFDTPEPAENPELAGRLAGLAGGRPMLVAGSTMAGEEGQVLAAFAGAGGGDRALLVLAPRHPERCDEVAALLAARGFPFRRRSALAGAPESLDRETVRPAVVLLDTLGELAGLYRHAAAAFIGGTLVPTGGHNPLEPARFGVPVAAGPSMTNFRDIADRFDRAGAWRRVADAGELGDAWRRWLDDPAAGREVGARAADLTASNRGAIARTLELLAPLLAPEGATSPTALTSGAAGAEFS